MKSFVAASSLIALAAAVPQGPPGSGAQGGPLAALPSCLSSCRNSMGGSDFADFCKSDISTANSCISKSSCSDSDKTDAYQALAQLCANSGATVTASPEASFSVTSGGSSWPTAWSTNSAWASAVSQWTTQTGGPWSGGPGGPGGWNGHGGPFGAGTTGWGPWGTSGSWTTGPWTSWWGTSGCPASTWSGWTSGSWSTDAPWTTWSGCVASTTATSVVTTTVTTGGSTAVETTTGFGLQLAQASNSGSASSTSSGSGAMATNFKLAGSAAGALGVVAGALLL